MKDLGRAVAVREHDRAAEHRRHERRHRLPEHVAERQQVQEADADETAWRTLRYFAISRSMGITFARMLRCVIVTPLGSAVAPDVKMISASDEPVKAAWRRGAERREDAAT